MARTTQQRLQRAFGYLAQGQLGPAHAQLDALCASDPASSGTNLLAAEMAWREDRVRDSTRSALAAARATTADARLACDVITALLRAGEVVAARTCLASANWMGTAPVACLLRVANFRLVFGEYTEALALSDRVLALGHDASTVHFYRGRLLSFMGRLDEAEAEYLHALREAPTSGEVALQLVSLRAQIAADNHLGLVDAGLRSTPRGTRAHAAFDFARYRVLEDLGRYDAAWQALAQANATLYALTRDYASRQDMALQRSVRYYAAHALPPSAADVPAGSQPIFIIGLPRSGTTVLERLLGNHSQVTAAGELFDFGRQLQWAGDHRSLQDDTFLGGVDRLDLAETGRRYLAQTQWRARGARHFIDKQTSNWMIAGLIHAALPGARILHMVREPADVCFSIYRALFGDAYAIGNDLATLAAHYRKYRRLMARWHELAPGAMLDVAYADLVRSPATTMRAVLTYCGLDWEPACTDLAANTSPESTMSAAQIRQPLHAPATEAWRHYASHLPNWPVELLDP